MFSKTVTCRINSPNIINLILSMFSGDGMISGYTLNSKTETLKNTYHKSISLYILFKADKTNMAQHYKLKKF